ncbi:DUF5590 domain-containing protein [Cohnella zeiphila]|uniref:DUF5590 domain-containing protein n=1 Tax=Cohnella zeiphila TaxID=2761120 RepID=A0A7X0SSS6_9BACL|nr:DUF5590 domain-containing protein [Cohnella zeiphila]MBB6735470.1 DUF5590 domain-containing protein [Cohnella zeiphila]
MSLSRSENRRRSSGVPVGRWIIVGVLFVVLVCISFVLYIRSAEADYRAEANQAIRTAKQEAGLKKTDEAIKHVWDDTVWVVTGKDADGNDIFVWELPDGTVTKEKAADGLAKSQAVSRFREENGNLQIVRIIPGWFQGQPVWEIRYESDPSTDRETIVFYSFKDGAKLKTYDLPGK